MSQRLTWCASLLATVLAVPASAAPHLKVPPGLRHLTVADGLSHDVVNAVAQDQMGFVWFGTGAGLDRFDGRDFDSFHHDAERAGSLAGDTVSALLVDSSGALWVGTWGGGLDRFEPTTETFTHLSGGPGSAGALRDNRITCLLEDRSGTLWVGTFAGGLARYDAASGSFSSFTHSPGNAASLADDRVNAVVEDAYGGLWVGTGRGLCRLEVGSGRFETLRRGVSDLDGIPDETILALAVDRLGTVWVGTGRGLRLLDASRRLVRGAGADAVAAGLGDAGVVVISSDHHGVIWVGTGEMGLVSVALENGQVTALRNDPADPRSLARDAVRALFEDASGVLWVGTSGGGVDRLDLKPAKFQQVRADPHMSGSLRPGQVLCFAEDRQGDLLLGTERGLERWDELSGVFSTVPLVFPGSPARSGIAVRRLLQGPPGVVWVGTDAGLGRLESSSGTFSRLHLPGRGGADETVTALSPGQGDVLWVGTMEGLVHLETRSGRARRIVAGAHDDTALADGYVQALLLDSRGRLWVGTDAGGVHRSDDGVHFQRFCKVPGNPGSLSADRVLALHEDRGGTIWVGTAAGLNAWNESTGSFTRHLSGEGFESDAVSGILEDDDGHLWLATDRGLSRLDPGRGLFRAYTASDGLLAGHSTPGSCLRGRDGTMYFGGFSGLTVFHPAQVADNPNVPRAVLRFVEAFDGTRFVRHRLRDGAAVALSWRENFFTVRYAALDFTDPERNRYAYKLEGLDPAWVQAGTRNVASYTNVDAGAYTFMLRGSNNDGVWNMAASRVEITVVPPFWATWWFRVVGFMTLGGALLAGYVWRERRLLAERHRLEELVAARTAELAERRDQLEQINEKKNEFLGMAAHDLRSPLGLIQGWTAVTIQQLARGKLEPERGIRDLTRVVRAAEQMNRLVNELLDISAIESGRLKLVRRCEDIRAILSDCEQMHSRIAAEKGITLVVQGNGPLPGVFADRERIQEVVVNLLSNAIKFTSSGGRVTVSCEALPGEVVTHVQDTGVGLTEDDLKVAFKQFGKLSARPTGDEPSTGLGLAIVKKIVELHEGRVWVTSEKGVGSTFSFSLPVAQ